MLPPIEAFNIIFSVTHGSGHGLRIFNFSKASRILSPLNPIPLPATKTPAASGEEKRLKLLN
jgi:hypothetical protein